MAIKMRRDKWLFILLLILALTVAVWAWPSVLAVQSQQSAAHLTNDARPVEPPTLGAELTPSPETRIFLPLAVLGHAQIFTVDHNGSDKTGNGSAFLPWATINHALEKVPDGALILVRPGTYTGHVDLRRSFKRGVTVRSMVPYQARLRNNGQVVTLFYGEGLTLEGFDIAHSGPDADRYVIQVQDSKGDGSGGKRFIFRNNVIHDSYRDDLIKVNNGAQDILIQGNVFYNMGGPDTENHIDINSAINVTVEDNIFFNDFEGSDRSNQNSNGHFIVVKDSNGAGDGISGSQQIVLRRNIFLNWQGERGSAFIGIGDGKDFPFYQASQVMIENNLFLGNAQNKIHAALKITSGDAITFRNNTVVGDLPGNTFAIRLDVADSGLKNRDIHFYNNIWSDPTGTMGAENPGDGNSFSDTPAGTVESFQLSHNLYWNGILPIPMNPADKINYLDDSHRVLGNPLIAAMPEIIQLPRWSPAADRFLDGSISIRQAFESLVKRYGVLSTASSARDVASSQNAPRDDIFGWLRENGGAPDIGAYEIPSR
jgi:hypothetical protein